MVAKPSISHAGPQVTLVQGPGFISYGKMPFSEQDSLQLVVLIPLLMKHAVVSHSQKLVHAVVRFAENPHGAGGVIRGGGEVVEDKLDVVVGQGR
jgi:hypothetical protein